MPDKSKCDSVFRSKTSMSNTSFHNFNSRSSGLRCDFSTNKRKFVCKAIRMHLLNLEAKRLRSQNPTRVYSTPSEFSAILCVLFGNLASCSLQNRGFSCYGEISVPLREDLQGASSGFGRLGENPARAIISKYVSNRTSLVMFLLLFSFV